MLLDGGFYMACTWHWLWLREKNDEEDSMPLPREEPIFQECTAGLIHYTV